jgi:NAD(P)H-dependent FMN reductase
MRPLNVLGVSSSMRERSFGTMTLKMVLDAAQKYEVKTCLLELRKVMMPLFNPDSSSMQSDMNLQNVTEDVNWADAFILVWKNNQRTVSSGLVK